jgi:hypothetical protein
MPIPKRSEHPARTLERPLKTARLGGILQMWAGLRVRKLATEAPLRPKSMAPCAGDTKLAHYCLSYLDAESFDNSATASCTVVMNCAGKIMVEFFSTDISAIVWRVRS